MNQILNVFQIIANVKTLGYGSRLGVWVQGCTIGCKGCCTTDSWNSAVGKKLPVSTIIDWSRQGLWRCDGLTLSGGEPSEQAPAVLELIKSFRILWPEADVLLYTGRSYRYLFNNQRDLAERCDVLVCGPFVDNRPTLPLRGSDNQTIHLQSDLARLRYGDLSSLQNARQFHISTHSSVAVGIAEKLRIGEVFAEDKIHG